MNNFEYQISMINTTNTDYDIRNNATDCTNFTHKSHILMAFVNRFAMFTDLKQPLVVLSVLFQKNL